ncbi:MAG: DUF4430 domain-containing protein [Candidatus Adlerbacteria bacterium]|nr:DUF4430 domain-containing protein [Candidatus Adlerbacteria bacterium]
MSVKKILQNVGLALMLLAFVWLVFYTSVFQPVPSTQTTTQENTGSVTLTIAELYDHQPMPISAGKTALAVLEELDVRDPAVNLFTKEYAGLGVLVEGIGELRNGTDGKYWQYRINGIMPQVGAGAYVLKDGDLVEWFFDTSQE